MFKKDKTSINENNKMATVLITGGAGFIGSHLADELLSQGNKVVILDNLSLGRPNHSFEVKNSKLQAIASFLK